MKDLLSTNFHIQQSVDLPCIIRGHGPSTLLIVPGGSAMEQMVLRRVARLDPQYENRPYLRPDGLLDSLDPSKWTVVLLQNLELITRPNFRIDHYRDFVNQALNNRGVNTVLAHSLGSLALMQVVIERMQAGQPVPEKLIFVDPLFGGLAYPTVKYLRFTRQLTNGPPALSEIMPGSKLLARIRDDLKPLASRSDFPVTFVFFGNTGENSLAVPFAAIKSPLVRRFFPPEYLIGGDGMTVSPNVWNNSLDPLLPQAHMIEIPGSVHRRTLSRALPRIMEIIDTT